MGNIAFPFDGATRMNQPDIYKSNALVEAQYRLSVAEQRIILACIKEVRRNEKITDDKLYSVSATQIAELSGTSTKQAYRELEKAALRLKQRDVRLLEEPNGRGKKRKVMVTGWVQTIIYVEDEGRVELRFTKDMLPYLSELSTQFTRYSLSDVAQMTSSHAIRLYELLCQWRNFGCREVSIEQLREMLQVQNMYPVLKDLKRRVIEPAVEQINQHSPLWVKYEQRKSGRRVSHLLFTFGEKPSEKPLKTRKNKAATNNKNASGAIYGIPIAIIESRAQAGESYEDAALRLLNEAKKEK